jgi:phosphohistidine swiveling domain-containing protein
MGLRVPRTWVCSARALNRYATSRNRLLFELRDELNGLLILPSRQYAVRSSAAIEDGAQWSMAGQYESLLRVSGVGPVLEAIQTVWNSDRGSVQGRGEDPGPGGMEVLIQEMVDAVSSGASFSRNPVTGADEVIIEAVEGTSESFLQRGATPKRWVVRDEDAESDWPILPTGTLREIARTTIRVAEALRYPADLEWAFDGEKVWWLQVRPITSLRGLPVYSSRISREYLPGLVKPLVWSINVPMINGAWVDLFERVVGPLSIDPLSLARQFHFRAYFNMSGMGALFRKLGLPDDALEQVSGLVASSKRSPFGFRWKMLRHLPRMLRFMITVARFHRGLSRWETETAMQYAQAGCALSRAETLADLVRWADGFLPVMRDAAQHRILGLLLHLIAGFLGRKTLGRRGIEDPSQLELWDPRFEDYDPTIQMHKLANVFRGLSADLQQKASELPFEDFILIPGTEELRDHLDAFLARFGHVSESGNDFSATPWSENPTAVLRMGVGGDSAEHTPTQEMHKVPVDRTAKRWAQRVTIRRLDRERIGAVFSKGFHLLHQWALRSGQILEHEGVVPEPEEVFYLQLEELRGMAQGKIDGQTASLLILGRKAEMADSASISMPDMILGEHFDAMPDISREDGVLHGIPTARGSYEGPVCVVSSVDEFSKMRDGDVLVVPFSDVAWTPLFARAGAIVAEAGGILSHSSIVAREFGVPAVVSVPNVCMLLRGRRVRVDGHAGTVKILDAS